MSGLVIKVFKIDCGNVFTALCILKAIELYTLKGWKVWVWIISQYIVLKSE